MNTEHQITPPPEMVQKWLCSDDFPWGPLEQRSITITTNRLQNVATQAAQWGADQQLEAPDTWIRTEIKDRLRPANRIADDHRADMRPQPPSLKEQALSLVPESGGISMRRSYSPNELLTIRAALESLPND